MDRRVINFVAVLWCLGALLMLFVLAAAGADYTPTISAAGGYADVAVQDNTPPDPGNICPDCNGKGWVGDGTHRFKCEPCDGTGKRTTTASVASPDAQSEKPTSTESQQPAVAEASPGASTSAPEVAEGHEAPSIELPQPDALSTYEAARREAVRSRELLVVVYSTEAERKQSLAYLKRKPELNRFVWLLVPLDESTKELFGVNRPAVVRHDPVSQTSRIVKNESDLDD